MNFRSLLMSSGLRALALLGLVAAAVALPGNAPLQAQARFERARTVIFANGGIVNTLDPMRADYAQTSFIASALYDTLVTYDAESRIVGRLATEFRVADDVRSIRIALRPGVRFQDGAALSAADIAYTLDRLKRNTIGIASLIDGYESTTIHDALNLTINLRGPSPVFLGALSKVYILNSRLVIANAGNDDGQAWLQSRSAGSGPYQLDSMQGPTAIVSRFDGHWDQAEGRPQWIVFRRIDESATQRDELRAGNVDVAVLGMGYRDAQLLEAEGRVRDARLRPALQTNVVFNTRTGPTADPRVRRAIRLAYDYEGGLANIRLGNGVIANGPLPSTMPCRPDRPPMARNLDEARRLLAEAGAQNLTLTLRFQPTIEVQRLEATLLQSNLREIGVTLNLEPISFAAYLATLRNVDTIPQMMLLDDFAQFPDPGAMLFRGFRSDAIGSNRAGYANPQVDRLLDLALATADPGRRCDLYKQVQTILDEDSVYLSMYTVGRPVPYRPQHIAAPPVNMVVFPLAPADFRLARRP